MIEVNRALCSVSLFLTLIKVLQCGYLKIKLFIATLFI
ncbi:hypothetical protein P20495_2645 [Pseudoalteromonas sp. BSi20495]|nr:hypothetical protein P20495_2645 [Pseudoalteromonas sp. BSi20495]